MSDDLHALRLLLAQVERLRDEALGELAQAETLRRAAAAQAHDLVAYRRDYEQRWSAQFCREGKIELVRCYQGFMDKLTQAVDQQARIAAQAVMQVEDVSAVLRGHELRAAGLRKLIERRERDGQARAERHEQKQTDERAARAAWMKVQAQPSAFGAGA